MLRNSQSKNLGEMIPDHKCNSPDAKEGYRFSKAMKNPGFISANDIKKIYLPMGFENFKIEGRGLGSVGFGVSTILYGKTRIPNMR